MRGRELLGHTSTMTKHNAVWSEDQYYGDNETVNGEGEEQIDHYWDYDDEY